MISIRITEDSIGQYWARVTQDDSITAKHLRSLHQRFKTHAEALAWAHKISRQWKASDA